MTRVLFDTSVLVATMLEEHPHHSKCFAWLQQVRTEEIKGFISTHSIAELYSVLTRFPRTPRINPGLAQQLIRENLNKFEKVALTVEDYEATVAKMVSLNLPGGGIFDALIAQAALKAGVDVLLTLNPNDFTRLGDRIARLVQVPI